jgi:putative membrane protein
MMWGWGPGGWGHWAGWFGPLFMFAFWALIITGGIFLVRFLARLGKARGQEGTALDILKRRYARGEIDKEEFEAKRKDLS